MFEKVGRKIQVVSVIVLVVLILAAIVGAIVLWSTLPRRLDGKFWIGLGTLAGGVAMAVFSSLMLQGYGIIVQANEDKLEGKVPVEKDNGYRTEQSAKTAESSAQGEWICPKCGKRNTGKYCSICSTKNPEIKPVAQAPKLPEREAGENEWKCPECGKINQNYVGTCGCGKMKP